MAPEQFAYWLQGYSEIAGDAPNPEQWRVIQDHLDLVFQKETPNRRTQIDLRPFVKEETALIGPDQRRVIC